MESLHVVDINADLGEGSGHDELLMPLLSSCSIACGGHYGTAETMTEAIQLAKKHKVKIGAHPSFPDKDSFGRKRMTLTKKELTETILQQIMDFIAIAEKEKAPLHHIKLHGALYNLAAEDAPTADAVVDAILETGIRPSLYVLPESILHRKAENLLPIKREAFIDRGYSEQGTLLPRTEIGAVIDDPQRAWMQFESMVLSRSVLTPSANRISINAETFCIHSDHQHAVVILQYIHQKMEEMGIQLAAS